jgi:hypothetical protein
MWQRLGVGLLLVFLCGCLQNKDELTINADGSGKVRIETHASIPPEIVGEMGMAGGMSGLGSTVLYPPVNEAEARKLFPGKDFTFKIKQDRDDKGDVVIVTEAEFKNINVLLASPYGRAHALSLKIENGALVLKAVSGLESVARIAEIKDDSEMGFGAMPGLADLQKKKGEMRSEFRVTLPNAITTANGTREGKTVAWIVERAKSKDAADFAQQLGSVSEATCPAEGLKLSPVTPTRLGLLPFNMLVEGAGMDKGAAPDTNKIAAAVKFIPYGLLVTRSLDLSGEGGSRENGAQLVGAIVLPQEYAPQKWGEANLDEVVDAKGNNLKPNESAEGRFSSRRSRFSDTGNEEEDGSTNVTAEQRHLVTLSFRPPDWKVNEIARIKGSVGLHYYGGSEVVKLTNAIPANWIVDAAKAQSGRSFDESAKPLSSAKLMELGLSLSLQIGMVQNGCTMLELQAVGKQAVLAEAQVFDVTGKSWPTFLQQQDSGEEGTCQIVVIGTPPRPLSLAFVVSREGAAIDVPIFLEHVPVTGK